MTIHYIKTLHFFNDIEPGDDDGSVPAPHIGLLEKRRSSIRLKPSSNYESKTLDVMTHDYFDYFERENDHLDENKLKAINMPEYMQDCNLNINIVI